MLSQCLLNSIHYRLLRNIARVLLENILFYSVAFLCSAQLISNLTLDWRLTNYGPWAKSVLPSNFVNKALLEHSHTNPFMYVLSMAFSCYHGRDDHVQETIRTEKLNIFTICRFTEKICRPLLYLFFLVMCALSPYVHFFNLITGDVE